MVSSNADTTIVIEAQDRATGVLQRVSNSLRSTLGTQLRSTIISMVSFSAILGAVGLSISGLVMLFRNWHGELVKTNQAVSRLSLQFKLSGMSVDRADAAINRLRESLSRASLQALPEMDAAIRDNLLSLTPEMRQELDAVAKQMEEMGIGTHAQNFIALAEAAAGNFKPLQELGFEVDNLRKFFEEHNLAYKEFLENKTPLEKMWDGIKSRWSAAIDGLIGSINKLLDPSSWVTRLEGFLNIFGLAFGQMNLGTRIREQITTAIRFLRDFDYAGVIEFGRNLGIQISLGLLTWLIGESSVEILKLAIKSLLKQSTDNDDTDKETAKAGQSLTDRIINAVILGLEGTPLDVIAQLLKWVQTIRDNASQGFFDAGWELAKKMGEGLRNGALKFLQAAINDAVKWVNRIITVINIGRRLAGNQPIDYIPGVRLTSDENFDTPAPGVTVPTPTPQKGPEPPGTIPQRGYVPPPVGIPIPTPIPRRTPDPLAANYGNIVIPVYIGDRKVDTIVVDALNRQVRSRAPGLSIA
jgi:hypothetical protein